MIPEEVPYQVIYQEQAATAHKSNVQQMSKDSVAAHPQVYQWVGPTYKGLLHNPVEMLQLCRSYCTSNWPQLQAGLQLAGGNQYSGPFFDCQLDDLTAARYGIELGDIHSLFSTSATVCKMIHVRSQSCMSTFFTKYYKQIIKVSQESIKSILLP